MQCSQDSIVGVSMIQEHKPWDCQVIWLTWTSSWSRNSLSSLAISPWLSWSDCRGMGIDLLDEGERLSSFQALLPFSIHSKEADCSLSIQLQKSEDSSTSRRKITSIYIGALELKAVNRRIAKVTIQWMHDLFNRACNFLARESLIKLK